MFQLGELIHLIRDFPVSRNSIVNVKFLAIVLSLTTNSCNIK